MIYRETLVLIEKVLGKTHKSILSIINKLVAVFCCWQRYAEALRYTYSRKRNRFHTGTLYDLMFDQHFRYTITVRASNI